MTYIHQNEEISAHTLVELVISFRSSYPKNISIFWLMRKLFPTTTRPVHGTNYYDDTAKEITAILRSMCPNLRGGIKKFTVTEDNMNTLKRANLINDKLIV